MKPRVPEAGNPALAPAARAAGVGVKLAIARFAGSLALASTVTLSLIFGFVLMLSLAFVFIVNSSNPGFGLILAVVITVLFNLAVFFISPSIMDLSQKWLYKTRWVNLAAIRQRSPKTADIITQVCADRGLSQPRLGIIEDQNPTAFTYGSLPNTARVVVSEGLFTYLDDEEVASVYAHEMGHIVHWDFAIMTLGSTLVQVCYLLFVFIDRLGNKAKDALQTVSFAAFAMYIVGTYLLLSLSRVREYFADHFAAEVTANPNALSRALVKIAYGIVEEGKRSEKPSQLLQGTRALGICDSKAAVITGNMYRSSTASGKMGRVFLWDMFNPWARWSELNSTHPLTGKRIRALANYAEQLDQEVEFDMASILREGYKLSKQRLYGGFALDLVLYLAEVLGLLLGFLLGLLLTDPDQPLLWFLSFPLIGFAAGTLIKALILYPDYAKAPVTDILELMANPYASPLRGIPAQLDGRLIGRGEAGYVFGSSIQFQDPTGLLYLRYCSLLGPIGNFLFGLKRVNRLIDSQASVLGWFRRGAVSSLDLIRIRSENGGIVNSYPRFWSLLLGASLLIFGLVLRTT